MKVINPYLNFDGKTEEAIKFYQSVFGGNIPQIVRYKDMPEAGKVKPEDSEKMMHMALEIGNGNIIMATDALEGMGHKLTQGSNINLSIGADSKEEADRIYAGLSAGGKATMPMGHQSWGSYFGMLKDKYGIEWMVSFE